jgi:DMSO/TMAO reductase YedYZ molybdopterin-dependent catalytic subunit
MDDRFSLSNSNNVGGRTSWRTILIFILSGIIIAGVFLIYKDHFFNSSKIKDLGFVEVKEYEGQDLSSINDFRENSIKGPQYIDKDTYRLKITGLVDNQESFTYDDVINKHQIYKKVVALNCVEGWSVNILWEGVLVKDLLNEAGISPDAKVIIFHAYDGYTTSFPIDYLLNNDIIMAYKMNGGTIVPERGFPFQLVAESKWGYKWIKWITEIELSDDVNYRGYWESRGYSNEGNLDENFY